jgi:hypothetical protein
VLLPVPMMPMRRRVLMLLVQAVPVVPVLPL